MFDNLCLTHMIANEELKCGLTLRPKILNKVTLALSIRTICDIAFTPNLLTEPSVTFIVSASSFVKVTLKYHGNEERTDYSCHAHMYNFQFLLLKRE